MSFQTNSRIIKRSAKDAVEMTSFMLETTTSATRYHESHPQDLPIAAFLVNSKTSKILLTTHDTRMSTRHPLNHSIMLLLKELPSLLPQNTSAAVPEDPDEEEQYYAQMYDVYVTHEPCMMCCMALVHSRIRRLIFWRGMKTGAREVGWMKGDEIEGVLNHRFMSFEGIPGALGKDMEVVELGEEIYA